MAGASNSSNLDIVDCLVYNENVIICAGRILYTNNWYTLVNFLCCVYNKYIQPCREKKYDIPFHKLSK